MNQEVNNLQITFFSTATKPHGGAFSWYVSQMTSNFWLVKCWIEKLTHPFNIGPNCILCHKLAFSKAEWTCLRIWRKWKNEIYFTELLFVSGGRKYKVDQEAASCLMIGHRSPWQPCSVHWDFSVPPFLTASKTS